MKKLRNLFLAVLVLIVSVFAVNVSANEANGTITITNAKDGRAYELYKIFDLTYSGSNVAYTIDSDWAAFFDGAGSAYIVENDTNPASLNPITIGNTTKYINITESNKIAFANAALEYARGQVTEGTQVIRKVASADGNLVFEDLELGYYLVYPVGATDKTGNNGTIASIDSTMTDLTITLKATYPTLTKDFAEEGETSTFDQGEIARFKLTTKVPDTTGFSAYTFIIHDEWQDGLALINGVADQFTVTIGDTTLTAEQYTLTYDEANRNFALTLNVFTNNAAIAGQTITVTYGLKVTENAIVDSDYNRARLQYSNNPKNTETSYTEWDYEYVYSSKIVVTKVDGNSITTKLEGATFVLKNSAGKYYYYNEETSKVEWVDNLEATDNEPGATKLTTGADGVITFAGLKDGTYTLVETVAPLGYNMLPEDITVTIAGKVTASNAPKGAATYETVKNYSGAQLPSTGGFGTKLFVIIGSLLAMVSGVVLVTNKRMAKEEM